MLDTVLFDLGNTLVGYYGRADFPAILEQAIAGVQAYLRQRGLLDTPPQDLWQRVQDENREAVDHRVRPLEGRLARIFGLDPVPATDVILAMCRCFLQPIFARACLYEDTLPVLRRLRAAGCRIAVVSNSPWGSPAELWREELERLGLRAHVDAAVFCGDVGWRKPARQIFEFTLEKLQARPEQCLFVGDDPRWDLVGPQALGMEAVLIDRHAALRDAGEASIHGLGELEGRLLPLLP